MAATFVGTISGVVSSLADGGGALTQETLNIPLAAAAALGIRTTQALANGANTVTIPTGYTYIGVFLPSGNTQTCSLRGADGDTGIPLLPDAGFALLKAGSGATVHLTTNGIITVVLWFI